MRPLIHTVTRKAVLTAVFVFALAATAAAAPQRGGGHSGGGGHFSGGSHFSGGPHFGGGGGFHGSHDHFFFRGGFVSPFWGPYYPYWGYPYGYPYAYPYGASSDLKTKITPKQAEVYVDGYYAGVADDFDGAFQRLHTSPGGHAVTLRLDGYRTVTENIYVRPGSTTKLTETMEKLAPGEVSEPVPVPTLPTRRSDGMTPRPNNGPVPQR
jgi:opacity protein-like surface antigen